ncbi:MAG: site-specific integrase [Lachnospiraceae bacterium]|nr:site-specific integrase [Lachnospiraceae bacterium]
MHSQISISHYIITTNINLITVTTMILLYSGCAQQAPPTTLKTAKKSGRPINNDTFNERLRKYCGEAGVPYLSSHKLRFTVASIMRSSGVDIAFLQKNLGHSNRRMTEHYIYEDVEDPKDMEEQLGLILGVL